VSSGRIAAVATRDRILDAAEHLFARRGYYGVSLRAIAEEAGVQLGLLPYHFGSKEGLYAAIFERRMGRINAERRVRLEAMRKRAVGRPPALDEILETLVAPLVHASHDPERGGVDFARMVNDVVNFGDRERVLPLMVAHFDGMAREFMEAMAQALPDRSRDDVLWAYHFSVGALAFAIANRDHLERLAGRTLADGDADGHVARLIAWLVAAIRGTAPAGVSRIRDRVAG